MKLTDIQKENLQHYFDTTQEDSAVVIDNGFVYPEKHQHIAVQYAKEHKQTVLKVNRDFEAEVVFKMASAEEHPEDNSLLGVMTTAVQATTGLPKEKAQEIVKDAIQTQTEKIKARTDSKANPPAKPETKPAAKPKAESKPAAKPKSEPKPKTEAKPEPPAGDPPQAEAKPESGTTPEPSAGDPPTA